MQAFSPTLPAPQTLYYSAGEAHPLETLTEKSLCGMVEDMKVTQSDKEHYITGWMGPHSVVVIHNYREKRGTSNGFVLTKENQYRLSVQSIEFRIPKIILWLSLRRNPRTMTLITYNTLGEMVSPLMQFRNMTDKPVKRMLEQDWQALNDYIGMACWQLENGNPLWNQLLQTLTPDQLSGMINAPEFSGKRLQKDGDYEGFWAGNVFIGRCLGPYPALQLLWRDEDNQMQPGYIYTAVPEYRGGIPLPSLRIRPHRGENSYLLNPFDAQHLHDARSLFNFAQGILTGMSPPLVEMMDRPDAVPDL
ncbi:hypothetical protein [Acerihabitans sp.]|uniref:hypothetical protein n=1 Tax=Acerihabitans sp. TaxID=2811394 RepID=UPI002EDAA497